MERFRLGINRPLGPRIRPMYLRKHKQPYVVQHASRSCSLNLGVQIGDSLRVSAPHTCPEVESLSTADGWRSGRSSETSDAPGNDVGFKESFIQMSSSKPPGGIDWRCARTSSFTSNEAGAPSPSFTGSGWERLDVNSLSRASSRRGLGQGRLIPNMPGSKLSGFSLEGFGVNVRVETGGAGSVMVVGTGLLLVIPRSGLGLLARTRGIGLLVALTAVTGLGLFLTMTGLEVLAVVTGLGLFTSTSRIELLITHGGLGLLDILGVITGEEAFGTTGGIFWGSKLDLRFSDRRSLANWFHVCVNLMPEGLMFLQMVQVKNETQGLNSLH